MKKFPLFIFLFTACLAAAQPHSATPDYKNPRLSVDVRVKDLIGRMTLEEKIAQIRHLHATQAFDGQLLDTAKFSQESKGLSWGFVEGFPLTGESCHRNFRKLQKYAMENTRLGIPMFIVGEALHGAVHEGSTIFPQNIALGSTFNTELAYRKAKAISEELHYLGINQILAPCVDVVRDLRWGRTEESYGEDPLLCGLMGIAEVKGYLESNISPMLKHYGPHGSPRGGLNLASVDCATRDLFDVYLKPFEMIISNTKINAIMSSYNSWNRIPNSASSYLLTDILRKKYGFKGYVYSDWGVIRMLKNFHFTAADDAEAAYQAFSSGLDVEASSTCYPSLVKLLHQGKISMKQIDQSVARVLRAKFMAGLFDDPYGEKRAQSCSFHSGKAVSLSREIADESVVLLKNEGILPLDVNKLKSIAVIGPNADEVQFGDYTWSRDKADGISPLEGIKELCGNKVMVNYARGCELTSLDTSGIATAVETACTSDVAIVFAGSSSSTFVRKLKSSPTSGEGFDLSDLSLTGAQQQLVEALHQTGKPVVVVLVTGKPFAIPWIKEHIPAILVQWYGGEQEGRSIAGILFGKVNPSGKLPFSFPKSTGHLPVFYNYLTTDRGFYNQPGSYEEPGRDYVFSSPGALWNFGYGLSYTTFNFKNVGASKKIYKPGEMIEVSADVTNEGGREGKEVVQVYVRDCFSTVMTPVRELKAFRKVSLNAGETKNVKFQIPVADLYLTDEKGHRFCEDGAFEIQVGNSSDHILKTLYIGVGNEAYCIKQFPKETAASKVAAPAAGKMIEVTGEIRDVQATLIKGAKVSCSGSETYSDESGFFRIKVLDNEIITIGKNGYETQSLSVEGKNKMNISLINKK